MKKATGLILATFVIQSFLYAEVARPPQFIAFAFDGSKSLKMWEATRKYTEDMAAQKNIRVPFTYFLSGVVFLKDSQKRLYDGPHHSAGQSDVDFGGDAAEVTGRIHQINLAIDAGQEMGSHANGHFHAEEQRWSESDWREEFSLFNSLISKVIENNILPDTTEKLKLRPESDVVGFRAPYLEVTSGLAPVLDEFNYRYDTSEVADMNYWPRKIKNIWNFPLAMLRIVDTNKRTLSMDYNFYVADSNAEPDPGNSEIYRSRTRRTYLKYFDNNYNGNRAPLHIGHHFSQFNGGAYNSALMDFAEEVCGKPEVKCVTYRELADYMDSVDEATIDAYQRGNFSRVGAPTQMKSRAAIANETTRVYTKAELSALGIKVDPAEAHEE